MVFRHHSGLLPGLPNLLLEVADDTAADLVDVADAVDHDEQATGLVDVGSGAVSFS